MNGRGICVCTRMHARSVRSRCRGTEPAGSSTLGRHYEVQHSQYEAGWFQWTAGTVSSCRFSQKHRYLSKDDLEVPLSNQDLQSTSLSWDNHLHTLSKKLSTSRLVFILHSCRPRCLLSWNCPVVTAMDEWTLFQFLSLFKTSFPFLGQHLTRASKRGRKSA